MKRVLFLLLLVPSAWSADLVTFNPGDPIRSSDVNGNFNELASRAQQVSADVDSLTVRVQALEAGRSAAVAKLQVFSTTQTFLGDAGRNAMNAACAASDARASFCSRNRYIDAIDSRGIDLTGLVAEGWLDNPPEASGSINCQHWNMANAVAARTLTSEGSEGTGFCSTPHAAVCCY